MKRIEAESSEVLTVSLSLLRLKSRRVSPSLKGKGKYFVSSSVMKRNVSFWIWRRLNRRTWGYSSIYSIWMSDFISMSLSKTSPHLQYSISQSEPYLFFCYNSKHLDDIKNYMFLTGKINSTILYHCLFFTVCQVCGILIN